jgi:2-keto-4-pentenoate hydratase/2-oxohepta-3-ene-1,7-dioic acid hydratase in catechol pathway
MRIARVRVDGRASTAVIRGRSAELVSGGVFGALTPTGESVPLSRVQILVPVQPSKILAIGINYKSHAGERPAPSIPQAFLKAPNTLVAHGQPIVLPADATNVHMEAEVVAVIGKRAKNITADEVDEHVFGYTAGNDVSGRDWQQGDLQWLRAKSSDTFGAVGPWIETSLKPDRIGVIGRISGREQQRSDTSLLIHSIRKCIAHLSRYVTLERGDLIYTGTPGTTAEIKPGDVCEVEVDGVGILSNPVVRGE